jgi:DNA-directed RNA polymerase subunit RPC12/RpoP
MDYVCVKCSEEAEAKDMDVEAIPAISEEELIEAGLDLFDAEIIE